MSSFNELASPAPKVEYAEAEQAFATENLKVEAAVPCEDALVEAAKQVEPGVTDEHKQFAPPVTKEEASHLSVSALRASGADFEGKAGVIRGGVPRNFLRRVPPFSCWFDERDFVSMGEVLRFVFVKANCVFIYGQETDPCPLYAIQLETVRAIQEDPRKPDKDSFTISPRTVTNEARENLVTILLKDKKTGKQAYQFTFDTTNDKSLGKRCLDVINFNTKNYGSEVVTASVVKAKAAGGTTSK